jgi:hypothetical protein
VSGRSIAVLTVVNGAGAVVGLVASQTYYVSRGTSRLGEAIWAIALAVLAASVALVVAWLLRVPHVRAGTRLLWHFSSAD